jgi:hypothetical protein
MSVASLGLQSQRCLSENTSEEDPSLNPVSVVVAVVVLVTGPNYEQRP